MRDRLRDLQDSLDLAKSMYVFVRSFWNTSSQLMSFFFSCYCIVVLKYARPKLSLKYKY